MLLSRSLRVKLVLIMLLVVVLLMTSVLVFLIRGVQNFYTAQFYSQMENAFTTGNLIHQLRQASGERNAVSRMEEVLIMHSGRLGIDDRTRIFHILDGTTGKVLGPDPNARIDITNNILMALLGQDAFSGSSRFDYMDVAVPIIGDDTRYVVYIIDNKQTVHSLNMEIFSLILNAVLIGFTISIIISLVISKTLLSPIQGMTKAAEAMADGDFSSKIRVESEDEIGILAKTFNDMASQIEAMLEQLKRAEKLRREFVANVSHELRTPLTSIRTYAETISDSRELPQETEEEFLRVIINESDRMTKIVQDLLELSRFDSGNIQLTLARFSIERSVREVYAAIALEARKRGHILNLELEWGIPMIMGDRARIEQVLMNIITNALKYTPDGGTIEIISGSQGTNIFVRIEDTGVGIPPEDLTRVFDRFYRVDKARTRESGGTGLGLSIARDIAVLHGGDIWIESTQGKGTSVTVTLPVEGPAGTITAALEESGDE